MAVTGQCSCLPTPFTVWSVWPEEKGNEVDLPENNVTTDLLRMKCRWECLVVSAVRHSFSLSTAVFIAVHPVKH